ncbi:hypothetical protein [Pseudobacteriovorax antillogorgiicola]|uniref:Uncharacterized protein n=1 Tax=Pseudobacteriovorax antillogorgiicola TaxID=1513793 RepID=A0A1Y6CA18_9BACT|nr:hypothetical protein [Pseudobacteriovorax antillogorgiicola]TCS48974.1 hypothetical protein EDD56_11616 [Pseudobacteriovorax antillogorgiicola]SMF53546.1 hypothetical protein SAMN06296036_116138 [Pseudobacteriovorax antillogorgiicola]
MIGFYRLILVISLFLNQGCENTESFSGAASSQPDALLETPEAMAEDEDLVVSEPVMIAGSFLVCRVDQRYAANPELGDEIAQADVSCGARDQNQGPIAIQEGTLASFDVWFNDELFYSLTDIQSSSELEWPFKFSFPTPFSGHYRVVAKIDGFADDQIPMDLEIIKPVLASSTVFLKNAKMGDGLSIGSNPLRCIDLMNLVAGPSKPSVSKNFFVAEGQTLTVLTSEICGVTAASYVELLDGSGERIALQNLTDGDVSYDFGALSEGEYTVQMISAPVTGVNDIDDFYLGSVSINLSAIE